MGTEKSEAVKQETERVERPKDDLCVSTIELEAREQRGNKEAVEIENRERRVSKQHTQIRSNLESESILQPPQNPKTWVTPTQKAVSEERDRKRLEILDRDLLLHLER